VSRAINQDLLYAVRAHLRTYAFGRENTKSKKALTIAVLGTDEDGRVRDSDVRKARETVAALIIDYGCPICSSSSGTNGGYWWFNPEDDPAAFDEAYHTDISYARAIETKARHLKDNVERARVDYLRKKAEEEKPIEEPLQEQISLYRKAANG